jgi:hypothetical protein
MKGELCMGKKARSSSAFWILVGSILVSLSFSNIGCSDDDSTNDGADAGAPCQENESYCVGEVVWLCRSGVFQAWENCAAVLDTETLNPVMQCVDYEFFDTDGQPVGQEAVCEPVPEEDAGVLADSGL